VTILQQCIAVHGGRQCTLQAVGILQHYLGSRQLRPQQSQLREVPRAMLHCGGVAARPQTSGSVKPLALQTCSDQTYDTNDLHKQRRCKMPFSTVSIAGV